MSFYCYTNGKYKLMLSSPMLHNTTAWENVTSSLRLCHVPHPDNIIIKTHTQFSNYLITFYKIRFVTKNILHDGIGLEI